MLRGDRDDTLVPLQYTAAPLGGFGAYVLPPHGFIAYDSTVARTCKCTARLKGSGTSGPIVDATTATVSSLHALVQTSWSL